MRTLILDNHDSFTYNLFQIVGALGGNPIVKTNDSLTLEDVRALAPTHIILSPGPGRPENPADFGVCRAVIEALGPTTPLLGVCLGHQGIVHALGGTIVHAPKVMHGKKSAIRHDQKRVFRNLTSPLIAMRYHSLIADRATLPPELLITAETDDGLIMGVRHRNFPMEGIQFHPESIGTPLGQKMIENFLF